MFWEGSSKKDFKGFPVPVQKDMGVALFIAQLGQTAASAKPWKGLGSGVYELVEDHRGDTFRAVYAVQVADAVHVLHAFQKKVEVRDRDAAAGHGSGREAIEGSARPLRAWREVAMESKRSHKGIDNVLVDLGFEDAEELTAKATLAVKFNELLEKRGLSQTEAAAITGMTQPKVSQVRRYKLQNISLERLMQALVSLDQRVEIVVRQARPSRGAGITVAAS